MAKAGGAAKWRIHFGPALEVRREGEPFRFRTRQQLWLFARLAIQPEKPLDRADAARLLWPDAEPGDARAYLRRALMELRAAGIDPISTDAGLTLDPSCVETDFEDSAASGLLGAQGENLAKGSDSPMLDEIRRIVRSRARKGGSGAVAPSPEESGDRHVMALLGESLMAHAPEQAMRIVAGHRYDFYTKAPEADILRFLQRLCDRVPEPSAEKVAVLCVMAGLSSILTLYSAADALYLKAIQDAEELGETALLARALAMRCGVLLERRAWEEMRLSSERALETALRSGHDPDIAFSYAARGGYQWNVGLYDEAVQSYLRAIELAEPGPHRDNPRHNLAFVWGVLGGKMETPPEMPEPAQYEGRHLPQSQAYERFALGIGHGRYPEAALGAATALAHAADGGMERLVAMGMDSAAIAFAKLGCAAESGACVRIGSRLRRLLEHRRSPMEQDALRRHVQVGLFASGVREWEEKWRSDDPAVSAHRVAARLRIAAQASAPG